MMSKQNPHPGRLILYHPHHCDSNGDVAETTVQYCLAYEKISLGLNRANFSDTVNQWVIYDAYVSYEYQKELQVNMLNHLTFKYFLPVTYL